MNDETADGVHWSFWAIGAVALIWHVMGGVNFFVQMNADAVAAMPETHRAIIEGRPSWATGGFAITVFGGALGSLVLLLRKSAATYLFIASLLGAIVTITHNPWRCSIDNRLQCLRHLDDDCDAARGGGVFDLVCAAGRESGLDQLGHFRF